MIKNPFLLLCIIALVVSSCSSTRFRQSALNQNFNYFQKGLDSAQQIVFTPLTIKPNDLLNIQVSSNTLYVVKESGQFSCREFRCLNVRFFLLKIVVFVFLVTVV